MQPSLGARGHAGKAGRLRPEEVRAPPASERPPGFRYAAVFGLTLALLVFVIVAPGEDWARAAAVALEAGALVVVVATSRARAHARHARTAVAGTLAVAVVLCIAAGVVPDGATFVVAGVLAGAVAAALVTGILRLMREHGVTLQAVAGALTIYLLVGLLFSWVIAFVSVLDATPYFAQGTDPAAGQGVYYSFAVLTTTGFGDLTAATPTGRALAVVEMLVGQLYLVTIIGVMVGNLVGKRR
jgi:Ion channel